MRDTIELASSRVPHGALIVGQRHDTFSSLSRASVDALNEAHASCHFGRATAPGTRPRPVRPRSFHMQGRPDVVLRSSGNDTDIEMPTGSVGSQTRRRRATADSADDALIRTWYAEHGRLLLGYAYRLTGDAHLAQDIVQETLLRAWRAADTLSVERGSIRGWLMTVARHVAVDIARARRSRPPEVNPDLAETSAASVIADHCDGVLDAVFLADALAQLPPYHREALVEVYFRGRTAVEASETLGVPVGTVKSRVYHALRGLRATLGEFEDVTA
jgi:RNA polymerase sigma-70 factor, ECF subfamily